MIYRYGQNNRQSSYRRISWSDLVANHVQSRVLGIESLAAAINRVLGPNFRSEASNHYSLRESDIYSRYKFYTQGVAFFQQKDFPGFSEELVNEYNGLQERLKELVNEYKESGNYALVDEIIRILQSQKKLLLKSVSIIKKYIDRVSATINDWGAIQIISYHLRRLLRSHLKYGSFTISEGEVDAVNFYRSYRFELTHSSYPYASTRKRISRRESRRSTFL